MVILTIASFAHIFKHWDIINMNIRYQWKYVKVLLDHHTTNV